VLKTESSYLIGSVRVCPVIQLVQEGLLISDRVEAHSSGLGLVASTSLRN
jgi:hypothetical protein